LTNKIRYGDYFREASIERNIISYDDLVPELQYDCEGNALPYQPPKIQLRAFDVYRIIMPYTQVRIIEHLSYRMSRKKIKKKNNYRSVKFWLLILKLMLNRNHPV
jgi:hypothetical protein